MNLDFLKDTGNIVVIVAILIFYARIMWLREDLKRRGEVIVQEKKTVKSSKSSKKSAEKGNSRPAVSQDFLNPKYHISNWALGGPGVVLMLVGVIMRTSDWFPALVNPYWYIPTALGALMLTFSINTQ